MTTLLAIALSYLLGSVSTGVIAGKLKGVDLREEGSGNPGATNAIRVLGPAVGVPVLLIDIAKGVAAVLLIASIPGAEGPLGVPGIQLACGIAVIVGNILPVFSRFHGGRGVATACGVFLALAPLATSACIVVWVALVALTRYVSVGSIVAAAFLPLAVNIEAGIRHTRPSYPLLMISAVIAIFVVVRHRPNIRRLVAGTENRFGSGKRKES